MLRSLEKLTFRIKHRVLLSVVASILLLVIFALILPIIHVASELIRLKGYEVSDTKYSIEGSHEIDHLNEFAVSPDTLERFCFEKISLAAKINSADVVDFSTVKVNVDDLVISQISHVALTGPFPDLVRTVYALDKADNNLRVMSLRFAVRPRTSKTGRTLVAELYIQSIAISNSAMPTPSPSSYGRKPR